MFRVDFIFYFWEVEMFDKEVDPNRFCLFTMSPGSSFNLLK